MPIDLEKLNPEQKQAVVHQQGPLLIVAGAGTGKTTVITDRIVYLIEQIGVKPEEILAVTFTEKAAMEMEERVDRALPYGYTDLWISTFHSFAERILKDNGLDIGLPNFKLFDSAGAWILTRQNLEKFNLNYYRPLGNPNRFIKALLDHFSKCKDQMIYPQDYLKYADTLKTSLNDLAENTEEARVQEVASAYHTYQQLLLENNFLDFGDLINYCLQLFQKRPVILKKYQEKFKYILVDEFQDTNRVQYELIKLLASPKNNLTVTADDDQAIYKFRGASVSNIKQFNQDFPMARQVCLVKNYRSCQNILDLSYNFIQANNPNRLEFLNKIDKKLQSQTNEPGQIEFLNFQTLDQEVRFVAQKITQILQNDQTNNFNDFVILTRANDSAAPFCRALERAGLPYQFLASRGLYQKPIILDVISYLKLLDNYHEGLALFRVLSLPIFNISNNDLMLITQESNKKAQSVFETISRASLLRDITQQAQTVIAFLLSLIAKHTEMAKNFSASQVLVAFLNDSGYLKYLVEQDKLLEIDLLTQFYKKIKTFEEQVIDPGLKNFLSQMNWELEAGEQGKLEFDPDQGPQTIKIMTVHGVKGLEFKYVFVVSLVDKRFPSISRNDPIEIPDALAKEQAPEGDIHLQEERRLFYVALTRAKKGLFLTAAQNYGGKTLKKPSVFLKELGFLVQDKPKPSQPGHQELSQTAQKPVVVKTEKLPLPSHFSFTQIAAFQNCPYQYQLAHIIKVQSKGKPSFSFGKTIHNTLNDFLRLYFQTANKTQENLFGLEQGQTPSKLESNGTPSAAKVSGNRIAAGLNDLLEIYEKNWIGDWYESRIQKDEYKKLGKEILKKFFDDFLQNPPQILKINEELCLEMPFKLKVGDNMLIGKIDCIEQIENGVRIIDYKTGSKKEKLEKDDKTQLLIYQIAAEEFWNLQPVELVYHYLEDNQKLTFLGSEAEKQKIKEQITQTIEQIKVSDFKATPGWQCRSCDFKSICQFVAGDLD